MAATKQPPRKRFSSSFRSFRADNRKTIDYKDLVTLKDYVMEAGRMVPSRVTGASASQQRKVAKAVKRARFLALMRYCDTHEL